MLQQLDICQKALSNFLEDKRSAFPRFYFIGDDDLLEVLIKSTWLFCNLNTLFTQNNTSSCCLFSKQQL